MKKSVTFSLVWYYLYFTDEETGTEKDYLPENAELVSSGVRT